MYLLNAFSLSMLAEVPSTVEVREISVDEAQRLATVGFESAVGHADTARLFSEALGVPVEARRVHVVLRQGDVAVVGQYIGPRLPEVATTLPKGAKIRWLVVEVVYQYDHEREEGGGLVEAWESVV